MDRFNPVRPIDFIIPDPEEIRKQAANSVLEAMDSLTEYEELVIRKRTLPGGGWTMIRRHRADSD